MHCRCRILLLAALSLCSAASHVDAQQAQPAALPSAPKLAFVIPVLIERHLESVDPPIRSLLAGVINPSFASFNTSIATQLSNLPVSSPASATGYRFDPQLGVYVASAQSLGPILSERAETIGQGKFFFALSAQRFQFDRLDDLDLRGFRIGFPLQLAGLPGLPPGVIGRADTDTYIGLSINQTTAYFTYGVTHWLDASLAVPFVTTSLAIRSQARFSAPSLGINLALPVQWVQASSTGIGDEIVRLKGSFASRDNLQLAVAADFRLPTGDEFDFHGAGAFGAKAFAIASFQAGAVSPHVNVGYEWNGRSALAARGDRDFDDLADRVSYVIGFDAALTPRFTLAVDLSDQVVIDGQRTRLVSQPAGDGSTLRTVAFETETRHETNVAAGFKARVVSNVVFTGNVLMRVNDAGLRARVVPNLGVSYLF